MALKMLVTGYPRGATRWAFRVLSSAGCDVGFCSVFSELSTPQSVHKAVVDSTHEIEVSWFGAPFIHHPALSDVTVVRLERHPLDVASSLYWLGVCREGRNTYMDKWHHFMVRHVKELGAWYRGRPCQGSLYFVCEWAENILQLSTYEDTCVKVEDGAKSLLTACNVTEYSDLKAVSPCNVSGCRQLYLADVISLPIGARSLNLFVERGYSESSWNAPGTIEDCYVR